ncbi:hypothetical protein JCM16358_20690 [Halanaerocella petrolearia]
MQTKSRLIVALVVAMVLVAIPVSAQDIKLVINGEQIATKLVVTNGRTLVPAQILADEFGAKVNWDRDNQSLKIEDDYLQTSFQIGDRVIEINSEIIPLRSRIKSISNQVMIPLRLLPKIYGGEISWEGSTKTVYYQTNQVTNIGINTLANTSQVVVNADTKVDYEVNSYEDPKRLVLDLYNLSLGEVKTKIPVNNGIIEQVRVSQFRFNPSVVRVVVDLKKMSSYQIKPKGSEVVLEVENNTQVVASSTISRSSQPKSETGSKKAPKLKLRRKKIVIDAGHGGLDPGAIGPSGVQEKVVNYQMSKKVNQLLKQEGFRTKMARRGDKFHTLSNRANQANNWSADLFVSIHANSNSNSRVNGTSTYAHWYASEENWALAWYVQSELIKRIGLEDDGLKAANFAVLRETDMPSILVETAFLSNPREERLLSNSSFQNQVAKGIVAGIKKYFTKQ